MPIYHDAGFQMHFYGPGQDTAFNISAGCDEILCAHGVTDALCFLIDYGAFIKVWSDIMCRGANKFDASFMGLMIGFGSFEAWQK